MRKFLRILAVMILLGAGGVWLAKGASRSLMTRTSELTRIPDPVTGLDRIEWKAAFVPGMDFLAAGLLAAGVLAGGSFLFRNKKLKP